MERSLAMTGEELKQEVCNILDRLHLKYKKERYSDHNSSIIGKRRRVDVTIINDSDEVLMHIECKYQKTAGTTEDKLFKAVEEANRDKRIGTPSIIVFGGFGWSEPDLRHALLNGSVRIEILEDWLMLYMKYKKLFPLSIQSLKDALPDATQSS